MDGFGNFISMMDFILDTKRKRHITGGILLSASLLFGGKLMIMNKKTTILLAFILGAASGSAVTWYSVKKKYEEIAQREIDSVKEVFANREKERNKDVVAKNVTEDKKEKPELKEYAAKLHRQGYTKYSEYFDGGISEEKESVVNGPYVISPEQFGENEDYEKISLTYYADQILADENDEIIEDVEEMVGFESLNHFGEYEDDSVFVRNDAKKCDYEILLDQKLYSDVINEMPHQMEV